MLPGLNGHLVSEYFLERELLATGSVLPITSGGARDPRHAEDAGAVRRRLALWRRSGDWLGPATSVRALFEAAAAPLVEALSFDRPAAIERLDRILIATIRASGHPVLLVVAPWGDRLDPHWRVAVTHAMRRSASWTLLFNGTHLRIVDAGRLYARRFLEFDVDLAIDDERTCAAFWSLLHASAYAAAAGSDRTPLHAIVEASELHASAVSKSLRDGVLAASADVLGALLRPAGRGRGITQPLDNTFEQALTIVYRILFLLFAEARGLVPLWHPVYRESYSVESLRSAAERPQPAVGLWDALRAIARLAHSGCRAGDLRVTPFNGRLFAPARTPLAERRGLDDEAARRAVLALSTRPAPDRAGRERIAYRDLGVEQLGAVYETLLDYEPRLLPDQRTDAVGRVRVTLMRGSGIRKATGSFYTPQPIADYLVRRTLGPLVREAAPERILQLRIVDPAMGSGAFLVSACRYLAEAYEAALVRTGAYHGSDFGGREREATRRAIAERCLYGVDVNPMAVQLARLSLWLATLAADRPLTFLDHHLQTGDSLLGAWLSSLRRPPIPGRGRRARQNASARPLFDDDDIAEALRAALPIRFSLEETPGDTIDQVRAKESALAALGRRDGRLARWKQVADLWCAVWFATSSAAVPPSSFSALSDLILTGSGALSSRLAEPYLQVAATIARSHRLFHWELEFPEAFFGADGTRRQDAGFDAVIGNPPWDMLRADAGSADARVRSRSDVSAVVRFTRDAGVYTAQSDGHANRYQLFVERAMALTKHGGRIGLVLPAGLAIDHGSGPLRKQLLRTCAVDALVGFENHRGVFPIHRGVRFLLLTGSSGAPTRSIACRLGERDPASLETLGDEPADSSPWFPVRLTPALLRRLSGDELAIPDIRAPIDLAIAERAASLFSPLGSDTGWRARFGRELNATDDRAHFTSPGAGLPVVEGKQIEPFRVDMDTARFGIPARNAARLLDAGRYERSRLAYRDVASATNRLTLLAAILPPRCVSTHTVFCLRTPLSLVDQHFLCGLFNSFIVNYLVRLRVNTHVTTAVVEGLPIPRRQAGPGACREVAALARVLARRADATASARLQALIAGLYQVSVAEFAHVLTTFPLIAKEEREAALRVFATETGRPQR
jgi:Eco57I restriction-modification methylase